MPKDREIPFRQIHMDFHTSPHIPDVGADFDPQAFARTLKAANVNSCTIFAKCHHGMSYYPTKVGVVHPALKRDLMGEMIQALHAAGIRAPIYVTVTWDEWAAQEHQEWLAVAKNGQLVGRTPLTDEGRWRWLCMNSGYADYLAAQTEEILQNYQVDGFFFDIHRQPQPGCVCNTCLKEMLALGLNPEDDADLTQHSLLVGRRLMDRLSRLTREHQPEATLFYNSRTRIEAAPANGMKPEFEHMTHIEIESLPSGRWGYDHFPLFVRYFQPLHPELLGMTGRFHRTWGDFGGLKPEAAMEYEVFSMLALGAKASIGDQLHPRGVLEAATYERIGRVYGSVAAKEPWCTGARPLADVGVLMTTSPTTRGDIYRATAADTGAMRMFTELQQQFHFLDPEADFSQYPVLVAPDTVAFDPALTARVQAYLAGGGKLLLTGRSGLTPAGDAFALDEFGLDYGGEGDFKPDYIVCGPTVNAGIPDLPHVQYERGNKVTARPGTEVLAQNVAPYFQRNWRHYCSHHQTPYDKETGLPAIARRGNVIYVASPLFTAYHNQAYPVHRQIIGNCLNLLLGQPLVQTSLPSCGQATLLAQPGRKVAHLLYYVWQRRAAELDIIEDVVPLHNVALAVRTGTAPRRVYLAPEGTDLEFTFADGVARCAVPTVRGHQLVAFEA